MHYYKKNIGDYHKKAGRLSMLEHGSYTLLIDACYDRERFPTLEEAIDWAWARTDEEIAAVKFVLSKFFTLEDGVYVQARIQEEINAYHEKAETNARIAREREEKRKQSKHIDNDSSRTAHEACDSGNEAPPNHKPITINQEPIKDTASVPESVVVPAGNKAKGTAKPKSLIADQLVDLGVDEQVAKEFIALRDRKRSKLTALALSGIQREATKAGWSLEDALRKAVERGWQSFEAAWVAQDKNAGPPANRNQKYDPKSAWTKINQGLSNDNIIDINPSLAYQE